MPGQEPSEREEQTLHADRHRRNHFLQRPLRHRPDRLPGACLPHEEAEAGPLHARHPRHQLSRERQGRNPSASRSSGESIARRCVSSMAARHYASGSERPANSRPAPRCSLILPKLWPPGWMALSACAPAARSSAAESARTRIGRTGTSRTLAGTEPQPKPASSSPILALLALCVGGERLDCRRGSLSPTTSCDSPFRLLARSRIRRDAGTGRLDGTGL